MRRKKPALRRPPEGAEGANPATFLEELLTQTYGREAFSQSFVVERAHRMPAKPPLGTPACVFNAKFLNYRDWDVILRLSREKGNLSYCNTQILVFPDFSVEAQRQRRRFMEVKKPLQSKHLKYTLLFPSQLHITGEDRAHFFEDPEAAISSIDHLNPA